MRAGKRVCFAAYGHPGVFVYPTHEAIRRARAEGFRARMLPGISAEACLLADLGIDMLAGAQSFEATDFLVNVRHLGPFSHVMLWQIGGLGDPTFKRYQFEIRGLPQLVRKLLYYYHQWHTAYLYEAPLYPGVELRYGRDHLAIFRTPIFCPAPRCTFHRWVRRAPTKPSDGSCGSRDKCRGVRGAARLFLYKPPFLPVYYAACLLNWPLSPCRKYTRGPIRREPQFLMSPGVRMAHW